MKRINDNKRMVPWKALTGLCMALAVSAAGAAFPAYAGQVTIAVDNQTGDDSLQLEVAVGGIPCMISADTGFLGSVEVPDGTVTVDARVIDDVYGYYDLEFEPEVDSTGGTAIRINLSYGENYGDEGEDYAPDLEGIETPEQWDPSTFDNGLPDTGMEEIDLSGDSADTGFLVIKCEPVNAFDEAVLTLLDENYTPYEIPLHMEPYFFRARVELPAGTYRETGLPEIKFNEYASPDGKLSYLWAHTGEAAFGGFIEIKPGEETIIDDLAIRTMVDGNITVTDSRYYAAKNKYEKEEQAEKELASAFEEKNYETLPETTLPTAEAPEEENASILETILGFLKKAAPFIVIVLLFAGAAYAVSLVRKKYRDNNRMY